MPEVILEPSDFEGLVRPLRRLKVSHMWQHLTRNSDTAKGLRSAATALESAGHHDLARGYEDLATKMEITPGRITFSTLSFELGALGRTYDYSTQPRGEASLHFGTCWRVESPRAIPFSSKTDQATIEEELKSFTGRRVLDLQVTGRLPELIVSFSGRRWIQSFGYYANPCWSIGLLDSSWVCSRSGRLIRGGF